jgi:hypothetical protein
VPSPISRSEAANVRLSPHAEARLERLVISTAPANAYDADLPVRPPKLWPRRLYADIVAELYHGERATLAICRRLAAEIESDPAKRFLIGQIADETRHAQAYERYLPRLGHVPSIDAALGDCYASVMDWRGSPAALVLAAQIVLEGEALKVQQHFAQASRCPSFANLNRVIAADEGRHIAFGRTVAAGAARGLTAGQRREIAAWVKRVWTSAALGARKRHGFGARVAGFRIEPLDVMWQRRAGALAVVGFPEAKSV